MCLPSYTHRRWNTRPHRPPPSTFGEVHGLLPLRLPTINASFSHGAEPEYALTCSLSTTNLKQQPSRHPPPACGTNSGADTDRPRHHPHQFYSTFCVFLRPPPPLISLHLRRFINAVVSRHRRLNLVRSYRHSTLKKISLA